MSITLACLLLAAAPVFGPSQAFVSDGAVLRAQGTPAQYEIDASGALRVLAPSPVRFTLRGLSRAGARCATPLLRRETVGSQAIAHRGCQVDERWTTSPSGLEHEVVLHQRPAGEGALQIELHVDGPWHHTDEAGHVFAGPEGGPGVRYGAAWALRADQPRRPYPLVVEHVEGGLALVVPEAVLAGEGAFPLVIDPMIVGPELLVSDAVASGGAGFSPTMARSPVGIGYVVWVDRRRGTQTDLFATTLEMLGRAASLVDQELIVEEGDQTRPQLVWAPAFGAFVLLYEQSLADAGTEIRSATLGAAPWSLNGVSTAFVAAGTALSADVDDAGVVLAYVEDGSRLQVARLSPTSLTPLGSIALDAGIAHTAVSASAGVVEVAVELYDPSNHQQQAVAFSRSDPSMLRKMLAGPWVSVPAPDRGTSLLSRITDGGEGERWLVTRAAGSGYQGWKQDVGGTTPVAQGQLAFAEAAGLFWRNGAPALAVIVSTSVTRYEVVNLELGTSGGSVPLATGAEATHRSFVVNNQYATWEVGPASQVVAADLNPSVTWSWPVTLAHSPEPQLSPRVALSGDAGLVVWKAGDAALQWRTLSWSPSELSLGLESTLVDAGSPRVVLGRHDLALSPVAAAVVWRELAPTRLSLSAVLLPSGRRVALAETDAGIDPPSDVGPIVRQAEGLFYVLNAFGGVFQLLELAPSGAFFSAGTLPLAEGDRSVALDCPRAGECVVAFVRPGAGAFFAKPNDSTPTLLSATADAVFVTHDDSRVRYVAWGDASGSQGGSYVWPALTLQGISRSPVAVGTVVSTAVGVRPVVLSSVGDSLALLDFEASGPAMVATGLQGQVATRSGSASLSGVVVYQWSATPTEGARVYARPFDFGVNRTDAGSVDAGDPDGGDGGANDAGRSDGGSNDGGGSDDGGLEDAGGEPMPADAGVRTLYFTTEPCGCGVGAGGVLAWGLLLWWLRRR